MVQQDVDIANDGGTDRYKTALADQQMSVCCRCI
jgi:hypothetical protein